MKISKIDSYTGAKVCDFPKVKKEFTRIANEQKNGIQLKTASIYKICKVSGHTEYFWPLRNRIIRELDNLTPSNNADLMFITSDHLSDLRLSDTGISRFSNILLSYFDKPLIDAVYNEIHHYNVDERILNRMLKKEDTATLKGWLRYYESPGPNDDRETFRSGAEKVKAELKWRKEANYNV